MISVIIPIYNAESYLKECLRSVLSQDYTDLQIILVNDGSTDDSLTIADSFARNDTRIMLLSQNNRGQAAARNRALEKATGEWIAFVDADDKLQPGYFSTLLSHINNLPDCDIIQLGYRHLYKNNNLSDCDIIQLGYRHLLNNDTLSEPQFPKHNYLYTTPWSHFYKRSYLKNHNIRFPEGMVYEDVVFTVRCWQHNPKIEFVPYAGYLYRENPKSTTSQKRDTQPVFKMLRKEQYQAKSVIPFFLILYTRIRLRMHFLLNRR